MQLYSEKRSIMNKLIGLLTCLCFSTNLAVAQNKDASSIIKFGLFADWKIHSYLPPSVHFKVIP